jgi:hypothetical protein
MIKEFWNGKLPVHVLGVAPILYRSAESADNIEEAAEISTDKVWSSIHFYGENILTS